MKKLIIMLADELLTPWSDPVLRGRQKQFSAAKLMPLLVSTFMFAMAGVAVGQDAAPISVLYWDGSLLIVIGPTSGYVIPAGATYAMDEVDGTGLLLASMPGTSSPEIVPGPNTSVPSITTPGGTTFQIPDAGNVASIVQKGASVTVTYKDGATATVPGTYNPPGSLPPLPAPAEQVGGELWPDPTDQQVTPLQIELSSATWVRDFLDGTLPPADLPSDTDLKNNLFNGSFNFFVPGQPGNTDTIVQRITSTPEPATLTLFGLGLAAAGLRIRRRRA
jgi:hypothetical protein